MEQGFKEAVDDRIEAVGHVVPSFSQLPAYAEDLLLTNFRLSFHVQNCNAHLSVVLPM